MFELINVKEGMKEGDQLDKGEENMGDRNGKHIERTV
jgi:hypothetical protein